MHPFPIRVGSREYPDRLALVRDMETRGERGQLDDPGQRFPADHFLAWPHDPQLRAALDAAATDLIGTASHAEVLRIALVVGRSREFVAALLDRLDLGSPPVPHAEGAPGPTLRDDLLDVLVNPAAVADPALRTRVHRRFRDEGRLDLAIRLCLRGDPDGALPQLLTDYARTAPDPVVVETGAILLARHQPDRVLAVAADYRPHPADVTDAFASGVATGNPTWASAQRPALDAALGR